MFKSRNIHLGLARNLCALNFAASERRDIALTVNIAVSRQFWRNSAILSTLYSSSSLGLRLKLLSLTKLPQNIVTYMYSAGMNRKPRNVVLLRATAEN